MKHPAHLALVLLALAMPIAAPPASRASTGDVAAIRVVDTGEMAFGDRRNCDPSAEGAFVTTIDFDKLNAAGDPYSEGDVWRDVYSGKSAPPGTVPTLIVAGGASEAAMTAYIWSSDESVVVPAASGSNTVSTVDVDGKTKKVLKVQIPAGAESATFSLKGADGATVGAIARIYLGPDQDAVYRPTGELDDVTVSRVVEVITAPDPTVTISLGGLSEDTVTADRDYGTAKKRLVIRMEPECDYPVTVRLNASVSGDDALASLQDIYDENIIRIADGDYGGDPLDQETIDIEIPADETAVYKNVYILGGTKNTGSKGIAFSTTKISGPDDVTTRGSCTLRINRSTPEIVASAPAFSTNDTPGTVTAVSGVPQTFSLELSDAYRDLHDTATGYTFKWACETEEIGDATGVVMNGVGLFEASAEFNAITDGTELTLCVVNPDGKTSAKVRYDLVVTDAKKTIIAFQDPTKLVFPESDTTMENIVLGLSQPYNSGVRYIFLESDDPASFACVDSSLKTSGAQVDRGRTTTVMPFYQMRFLDGTTNATVKAVLYKNSDHSSRSTDYTAGTLSFAITNVPPRVVSVTAAGQDLTPDMAGQTIDPVSVDVLESFTLVADDVMADLSTVSARWVVDGTQYDTKMDPANRGRTLAVKHAFASAKEKAQVSVYLKDKDMAAYPATPNFLFYVPVSEKIPPTVSNVRARQRWPWNGLVDVDYEVGGYTEGLEVRISFAKQGDEGRPRVATRFLAGTEPSAVPGRHRATWDAAADGAANFVASNLVATVALVEPDVWLLPRTYELYNGDIYLDGYKVRSADDVDTNLIVAPGDSCTCLLISSYEDANGDTRYKQIEAKPAVAVESDEKDMFSTTAEPGKVTVTLNQNTLIGSSAAISCSVAGCRMKNSLTFATASMRGIKLYLPESGRPQRYDKNAWDVYARVVPFADNSREVEAGATYQKATLSNDKLDELLVRDFSYVQDGNTFVQDMYRLEASVPISAEKVLVLFELRAKNAAAGDWGFVMPAYMIDLSKSLYEEDRNYTENDYVPYDADYFFPLWTAEFNTNQTPFGTYKGNAKTKAFKVGDGVGFHTGRMTGSEGSGQGLWTIGVSHVRPLDAAVIEGGLDDGNMKAAGTGETCLLGSWYGVEGIVYPIHFTELSTNPSTYSAEPTLLSVTE